MSPLNENKYNHHSKSKGFFFLKQNRFDSTNHPIRTSRKELKFRMKTILSQQEEQMLVGLINTLQCEEREAIRIALYEAARRGRSWVEGCVPYASRFSTFKAHVGRSRQITVALTKSEKNKILSLADELELTEKEVVRLSIIWLQRGIKLGQIRNIEKCKLIAQDKLAREWSRENQGKSPNPKTAGIRDEIHAWQELFDMEVTSIDEALPANSCVENYFAYPYINKNLMDELRLEARKNGKDIDALNARERQLFGLMYTFQYTREEAEIVANDDYEEYSEYMKMSKRKLVQFHTKEQESDEDKDSRYDIYSEYQDAQILKRERAINLPLTEEETKARNFLANAGYSLEDRDRALDLIYEFWKLDKKTNN